MKNYILYSFFLLLFSASFAQSAKIADLKKSLININDFQNEIKANIKLGKAYMEQGVYLDSAYFHLDKALKLALENNDEKSKHEIYTNLARTYNTAESWDKAADYFEKTIPYLLEEKNYANLSHVYNDLGKIYFKSNDYEKAETFFHQSIQSAILNNSNESQADSYIHLAEIKLNQNKFYEAQKFIEKLDEATTTKNLTPTNRHLISAKIYCRLGKLNLALREGLLAYKESNAKNDINYKLQSSETLHAIYEKSGRYKDANIALKKVLNLKDSIQTIQRSNEIEKMDLKMQLQAQEKEVEALEQKNTYRYLIYMVFTIALILLTLLIFRQIKVSKMTHEMYDIQKKLISTELEVRHTKSASTLDAAKSADTELSK